MADLNDETIRELNDRIRELTEVMQSAMGITGSSTSNVGAFSKSTKDASSSAATLNIRNKEVSDSAKNVATSNKVASEAAYAAGQSLGKLYQASKDSKDALVTLGKTLLDTREGMSKYNAALNQAAGAAATGLSAFGPIGKVLGMLLKPLTMLVERVFAFQDNLFVAKDELAKFGAVGQLTTTDIQKLGKASGYSTFEIEKYAKMVTKAGIGLVGLGGSVSQGVVEFAKLTSITKEEQYRLLSLGVTMDEFVENTADFVKLQTTSGRMITEKMKTDGYLQRTAKEYTENLLVLAALSGESVAEQKQKQMLLAQEREVQIANLATSMKIKQLENGTEEDKREAARLQKEMDLKKATVDLTAATLGMDAAKSLQHFLATGVMTPETMKIMRGTGMSLEELRLALSQGKDVSAKFVDSLVKGDLQLIQSQGLALQLSREYADGMGLNSERLAKVAAMQGKSVEQVKKEIEDKVASGKLEKDQAEINRKEALDSEKKFRASVDTLSSSFQGFIPEFNKFTQLITNFLTQLNLEQLITDMKKSFSDFMTSLAIAGAGLVALSVGKSISDISGAGGGKGGTLNKFGKVVGRAGAGSTMAAITEIGADALGRDTTAGAATSILGSAASGAMYGSMLGPKGAAVGAALGAGYGLYRNIQDGIDKSNAAGEATKPTSISDRSKNINDLFNFGSSSGSKENFEKLNPNLKNALIGAATEYNQTTGGRGKLTINSAWRDPADQIRLYKQSIDAGTPGTLPDGTPVAKPGSSRHERGLAVDIQEYRDKTVDDILLKYGLDNLIKNDSQHYEMPGARLGGSFSGPNSGYPVMLHGAETVVPTPNPNTTLLKLEGDAATDKITNALSGMNSDALKGIMQELYSMMDDKMSEMIDKLSTSNDIQDKLLKVQM